MMKYLLPFLEGLPDGPDLSDPDFQRLLVDVQAGKSHAKSADAFNDSLDKIVNELKSTPESLPFQKPVAKRDAPDYYDVIKKPMDLFTIARNIKNNKYKSKADFAADLDLIWENCFTYNTHEGHPIRASARFMKQKADHHLEFLVDRAERGVPAFLNLPPAHDSSSSRQLSVAPSAHAPLQPSPLGTTSQLPGDDEDAAGESDDGGMGDGTKKGDSFRQEAGAGPQSHTAANGNNASRQATPVQGRGRSASIRAREGSVASVRADAARSTSKSNASRSTPPFRPKLQTSLENAPAMIRTPYSMASDMSFPLDHAGPSTLPASRTKDSSRSRGSTPPSWYPTTAAEDDDARHEAAWWTVASKDESYTAGLPAVPIMLDSAHLRSPRVPKRKRLPMTNGHSHPSGEPKTPPLEHSKAVDLGSAIHRNVDKLNEARKVMGLIQDWQRIELDGGVLPPSPAVQFAADKAQSRIERQERRRHRLEESQESNKRRKLGQEVGEREGAYTLKKASAGLLAHAGFEGANEIALDMFTRIGADFFRNMGRTLRLLQDGFSHKMSPEEMILHALHENGQIETAELEAHIKDDIEREGGKMAEMTRKVRQAYKEVATPPVIEDDMLFSEQGGMFTDGNFADELGEDYLGLKELGIDREFGLSSLTVPSALFHGRRRKAAQADAVDAKADVPDYPPPPPFAPLTASAIATQVPALLHAFFAARIESGKGLADDEGFDPSHSQISSLGQVIVKVPGGAAAALKKKKEEEKDRPPAEKKIKPKKPVPQGVGKGNWVRPSKEEKEKRAAEKLAKANSEARSNGPVGDEDAEGEDD